MRTIQERAQRDGDCLIFMGGSEWDGYARIQCKGRFLRVHRIAYEQAYGPIPPGMLVCHRCDRRRCIEPAHLFLGTHADNNADRDRKGRARPRRAEANGRAKLTWPQVEAIRREHAEHGTGCAALAKRYGVTDGAVRYILRGAHWKSPHEYGAKETDHG